MSRGPYPMLLMLAMSLPGAARALGLGDIRISSALNEPLSAQIDIVGSTREELAALTASVANREIFQRYGADRPAFLSTATFKVGVDGQGKPVLVVRSSEPFTDPLVSLLVDLRWGKSEVVREYSLLLDPPGYTALRPAAEVELAAAPAAKSHPAVIAAETGLPAAAAPPTARTAAAAGAMPTSRRQSTTTLADSGEPMRHRVAAGETLRAVTRQAGARSEAHAQRMMIAIFRANPSAFDGNINRLHRDALLTIPAEDELAAISSADAKREVRAHMTAWRLDGRPNSSQRVASAATPALSAPAMAATTPASAVPVAAAATPVAATPANDPDAALKARVQSLEQSLDDMHKQLANENARLQSLKDGAAQADLAAAAVHSSAAAAATASIPAPTSAPVSVLATAPAPAAVTRPGPTTAELVSMPIIATARAEGTAHAAVSAPSQASDKTGFFAPVALTLGVLLAGFAYFGRRRARRTEPATVTTAPTPPVAQKAPAAEPAPVRTAPAVAPAAPKQMEAIEPAFVDALLESTNQVDISKSQPADMHVADPEKTTVSLEIDIEALERSYLDSLPIETTAIDTVAIDTSDLDSALLKDDLNTVVIDARQLAPAIASTALDYNLIDLDASSASTAQHVHMPSDLHDHPVVAERRTNIVDVLKLAIDRDPHRRDLRMKLLETYYSAAATNQRAFVDVVRKLARERDYLSPEDWNKVMMMGKQIASDDILFADVPKDDADLANCA
jgi:pilus assembly protein FimV